MKLKLLTLLIPVSLFAYGEEADPKENGKNEETVIVDKQETENQKSEEMENIEPKGEKLIATFEYVELGDYFHFVFSDENGKYWDFGSGENELGEYYFGDDIPNEELVGKKFEIYWEKRMVKSYDLNGLPMEIEALCINQITLME